MREEWNGFKGKLWQEEINVRDFIQQNYTPYDETTPSWQAPPRIPWISGLRSVS